MILYAVMAQTSVVKMFVAGIIPGILGGLGLMALAYYPGLANIISRSSRTSSCRGSGGRFREAAWALILPVIILGGIFGGFVTATEGAGARGLRGACSSAA